LASTATGAASGRAESEPFTLDVGAGPSLVLEVASITLPARLIVQIQEVFGEYRAFDAVTITEPGLYSVEIAQLVGSVADQPYAVVMWLEGVGAAVEFDVVEMRAEEAVGMGGDGPWSETFDTEPEGWMPENSDMYLEDGVMVLFVADQTVGYGKIETAPLLIDVEATPILEIETVGVEAETAFSVQLQEQSGAYATIDLLTDIIAPTLLRLDLSEYVAPRGANPYRLVFWVSGKGSVALDEVSLRTQ
jgi:hypothetical protein